MATFAQLDENNIVINVIVAEQEYIDSGTLGDPLKWVECCLNHSIRQRYPGLGYSYHPDLDEFIPPKPDTNPSFVWNGKPGLQGQWCPPTPHPGTPDNGIEASWNESLCRWDIIQRPIPYPVNNEGRRYRWNDAIQNWEEGPVTL